jgi:drug/metabolite transporter (DMT)-like permease
MGISIFFWASAFAGIRAGLAAYSPGHLALLRFLVASAALAGYAVLTRMGLPDRRDVPALALTGFTGITMYHVALNYGEITVSAGAACFLVNLAPIFTALLATVFLGERLNFRGWLGMIISLSGVVLIALGEGNGLEFEPRALLVLLAAVGSSFYFILQKPLLKKYTAFQSTTYAIWAGTLFMLPFSPGLLTAVKTAPLAPTLTVVYLGVFPAALAYVTWSYVLARIPAAYAASFLYLAPPLAALIAWIWLKEIPTAFTAVGGIMALAGVLLTNRGTERKPLQGKSHPVEVQEN